MMRRIGTLWWPGLRQERDRKKFFFEKKNQKTFACLKVHAA
jgi:hypothetical protein